MVCAERSTAGSAQVLTRLVRSISQRQSPSGCMALSTTLSPIRIEATVLGATASRRPSAYRRTRSGVARSQGKRIVIELAAPLEPGKPAAIVVAIGVSGRGRPVATGACGVQNVAGDEEPVPGAAVRLRPLLEGQLDSPRLSPLP